MIVSTDCQKVLFFIQQLNLKNKNIDLELRFLISN